LSAGITIRVATARVVVPELPGEGLASRFIAISAEQLRAVPDVVAIAGGAAKAPAIHAALQSGLIHRLITDEEAARLLLAI